MKKISSQQVALLAGVSRATVSRMLNDPTSVSIETKKRIYAAMNTLGYRSSGFAHLSHQWTDLVALALFGSEDGLNLAELTTTRCYFYLELLRYIERSAARENIDLFLPLHPYDPNEPKKDSAAQYALALQEKRVSGVIALALRPDDPRIQGIRNAPIPAIFIDNAVKSENATYVTTDFMGGAYQATEYLISLGHQRIAFFPGDTFVLTGTERLLGYQRALAYTGLIMDTTLIRSSGWETQDAYQAAMTLLNERRDFTAIFAASDMLAFGVLRALKEHKLRVPEDISLIGFDDIDLSERTNPALTTIQQDKQTISDAAISKLMQLLHGEKIPQPLVVPTRLIARASTAPISWK